ncbi:MAG: hemin uptake protein HemP [Halocynthiibacter sp.]|jgi:hemin uptake protein HemP
MEWKMHSPESFLNEAAASGPPEIPVLCAHKLTSGGQIARIMLGEKTYTLRITRADKLILTK